MRAFDSFGPLTTVTQLAEVAEQLGLFKRDVAPTVTIPAAARPAQTEQEIVKDCKSEAAGHVGAYLRRLGYEPSDGNYQRQRMRVTKDINRSFGINSTEVITTKERAREYVAHVKQWVSDR